MQQISAIINRFKSQRQRDFFQICRILTRISQTIDQTIQFHTDVATQFAFHDITDIQQLEYGIKLVINFMGLLGVSGILPMPYIEKAIAQQQQHNTAYLDFFDMLQQRTIELFYSIWAHTHPTISYERATRHDQLDHISKQALSLIGISDSDHSDILPHVHLFLGHQASRQGFMAYISATFNLPIDVEEMIGHWEDISPNQRTKLGLMKAYNQLGRSAILGGKIWQIQNYLKVVLGPLNETEFLSILPNTTKYQRLVKQIRYYLSPEIRVILQVKLDTSAHEYCYLGNDKPLYLGWNTWLKGQPRQVSINLGIV